MDQVALVAMKKYELQCNWFAVLTMVLWSRVGSVSLRFVLFGKPPTLDEGSYEHRERKEFTNGFSRVIDVILQSLSSTWHLDWPSTENHEQRLLRAH